MTTARPARRRGVRAEVPITREMVVDAAFRMIDERGNSGFSMRSLATELGVFPATVYWHVGDRAQLLGLVQQRWMESIEAPADSDDWREWMFELARRYRANAHRHPNIARLVSIERARNVDTLLLPDAVVGVLRRLGFDGATLANAYNALIGALLGFIAIELSPISESGDDADHDTERDLSNLEPDRFPNITSNFDHLADRVFAMRWTDSSRKPLDESFEYLLRVLIDGLASQIPADPAD